MSTELDNRMVWDGRRTGHYEVWYLTGNLVGERRGFWIRYTLEAPLREPAYAQLWFAHFDADHPERNVAVNRQYPIDELRSSSVPFALDIGSSRLTHFSASGALDDGRVRWDLHWQPVADASTLRQLPPLFYARQGLGDTTVLTPQADLRVDGTIEIHGQFLQLKECPFGQTHLWGRKHAFAWAWGHYNAFDDGRDGTLEVLSARLRRGPVLTPPLTVVTLRLDGRTYRFNRVGNLLRNRGRWSSTRFEFEAQSHEARLRGRFDCRPEDMVQARYIDPDGEQAYCCNTEVAELSLQLALRDRRAGSFREATTLGSAASGHFEIGSRKPDPAIGKHHRTI